MSFDFCLLFTSYHYCSLLAIAVRFLPTAVFSLNYCSFLTAVVHYLSIVLVLATLHIFFLLFTFTLFTLFLVTPRHRYSLNPYCSLLKTPAFLYLHFSFCSTCLLCLLFSSYQSLMFILFKSRQGLLYCSLHVQIFCPCSFHVHFQPAVQFLPLLFTTPLLFTPMLSNMLSLFRSFH